jgi:hypothetical protein
VSTCVILRSVADIARAEGHDITSLQIRLECLQVFAFGGKSSKDDAAETGYWEVRAALSRQVVQAVEYIGKKGLIDKTAAPVVKLIQAISPRFAALVGQQVAAMAAPVIGGLAGGTINYLFMDHFQDMAAGHFVIRRLEKKYGPEPVRRVYDTLEV